MKKSGLLLLSAMLIFLSACGQVIQPAYTEVESPKNEKVQIVEKTTESTTFTQITEATTTALWTEPHTATTTQLARQYATEQPAETTTTYKEPVYTYGTAGRLDIPSVGVGVALYDTDLYQYNVQSIVDESDSAAIFPYRDKVTVIADHNNQGFDAMKSVEVGDYSVISQRDGSYVFYLCTRVCYDGHNLGTDIVDEYGEQVEYNTDGELIMYTCNDCWQNITISYWQRTD